jgi:alkyl hydroperoxide reductase subunit AhpC
MKYDELKSMDCLVATLSVDPVRSHTEWLRDVVAHCENKITVDFPIIADADRSISTAYGMIDPGTSDDQSLPLTIRAVFIINPENKLMLSLNYPACVGRNTDEIVRCVKALQLSYEKSVATPANWPMNHADLPLKDGTRTDEFKGSVFLLPTVRTVEVWLYKLPFLYVCVCGCICALVIRLDPPLGNQFQILNASDTEVPLITYFRGFLICTRHFQFQILGLTGRSQGQLSSLSYL